MVHTGDLDGFRDRLDHESSEILMRSMGSCLQASSAADQTAGQMGGSGFVFLHDDAFGRINLSSGRLRGPYITNRPVN